MKRLFGGIAMALTIATIVPARAQAPWPVPQPQSPVGAYADPYRYRFASPTPSDAYRDGLITRTELEQLEGPLPAALQGPSPNGRSGFGSSN